MPERQDRPITLTLAGWKPPLQLVPTYKLRTQRLENLVAPLNRLLQRLRTPPEKYPACPTTVLPRMKSPVPKHPVRLATTPCTTVKHLENRGVLVILYLNQSRLRPALRLPYHPPRLRPQYRAHQ
jgi:hypothetical protein